MLYEHEGLRESDTTHDRETLHQSSQYALSMDRHALNFHLIEVHSHPTLRATLAYLHNTDDNLGTHAWDSGPATHKHGMRRYPVLLLKLPRLLEGLDVGPKVLSSRKLYNCSRLRTDVRSCALSATLVRLLFFTASGIRMSSANSFSLATSFGQHQTADCPMQPVILRPPGCHMSTRSAPGPVSSRATVCRPELAGVEP
jgi:hypothetical protein